MKNSMILLYQAKQQASGKAVRFNSNLPIGESQKKEKSSVTSTRLFREHKLM